MKQHARYNEVFKKAVLANSESLPTFIVSSAEVSPSDLLIQATLADSRRRFDELMTLVERTKS